MNTIDDLRDLAIRITDEMVQKNLIKDCIDTDNEDEFTAQDIIFNNLLKERTLEVVKKPFIFKDEEDIIEKCIDEGVLSNNDLLEKFKEFVSNNGFVYDDSFDEHYQNLEGFITNLRSFKEFKRFENQ